MPERRKAPGSRPGQPQEWGITVRLRTGQVLYYFEDPRMRSSDGGPLEAWGRESQAARFVSKKDASNLAGRMQVNGEAKEYLVVPLPKRTT